MLHLFQHADSEFVWFIGMEDFINSYADLDSVITLLESQPHVAGVICAMHGSLGLRAREHLTGQSREDQLNLILSTGKVSRHIIRRFDIEINEISQLIGAGYMHLSLQAIGLTKSEKSVLVATTYCEINSSQQSGDFNRYHPKFACDVADAMDIPAVLQLSQKFFAKKLNKKLKSLRLFNTLLS